MFDEWTAADRAAFTARGITPEQLDAQIAQFKRGFPPIRLDRPCTLGDGIDVFGSDTDRYLQLHAQAAAAGRLMKFVPASGAASRMFRVLLSVAGGTTPPDRQSLSARADGGDTDARTFLRFVDELDRFAFSDDLRAAMSRGGHHLGRELQRGRYERLLRYMLTPDGLNYAGLPKGLVKFHRYAGRARSACEEHLVEAAEYVRGATGVARVHFTLAARHGETVRAYLDRVTRRYGSYDVRLEVGYSLQKPSTDTLAVDTDNAPVRDAHGMLVFRPGGHGTLLENLGELGADIVYIKNIDNVLHDRWKPEATHYKKLLCGYLIELQQAVFSHVARLEKRPVQTPGMEQTRAAAHAFVRDQLALALPAGFEHAPAAAQHAALIDHLNRPLRVCGVVKNTGQPGGGPFWVTAADGTTSRQLVESSQVDMRDGTQRTSWTRATHFNPVDLVCGLRDYAGRPFDLDRFRDPATGFISEKLSHGRTVRALELPGLWNGGMAGWNTIFVEVPAATFQPVKTVTDLLQPAHCEPSEAGAHPPLTSQRDS